MSYKDWIQSVDKKKSNHTSLVFKVSYCFWVFVFDVFKGFLYAFGAWVFIKMIGITL
tara:strand:+ start:1973 stop:2143 length:171 start_codon:yes stop_codon:yes gene_type:complete